MQAENEILATEDTQSTKREKKGRALAAMGHVARTDDGFDVVSAGRKRQTFRVWRDIDGRVRCNCPDFEATTDPKYRCEHILAVKFYLEPPVDDVTPVDPALTQTMESQTPTTVEKIYATPEAYALAQSTTRAFENILVEFKKPLPDQLIRSRVGWTDRSGREHEVDYIEWHVVADILDQVAPAWCHHVKNIIQIGGLVAVTAAITIDGVTREGIGTGEAVDEKGIKKAEHDALKRAAVKFGIARELYRKDSDGEYDSGRSAKREDPVAHSLTDLITPKQLVAIRAIANANGVDPDTRSQDLFGCRPEELTKKAASQLITDLKGSLSERAVERKAS